MKGPGGNLGAFHRLWDMSVPSLTPEELRVLRYCAQWPHWLSLLELSVVLHPDDIVTVPSVVERGVLAQHARLRISWATAEGRVAAR